MNTDYGLRVPTRDEIRATFTTLQRAVQVTGGDINLLLLYIHNPDRIATAPEVDPFPSEFAKKLREDSLSERVVAEWQGLENPHVATVADKLGIGWRTARDLLVRAGKYTPARDIIQRTAR